MMRSLDDSNSRLIALKNRKTKQDEINVAIEIHTPLRTDSDPVDAGWYLDELWNDFTIFSGRDKNGT
jgi:hypothetical protein